MLELFCWGGNYGISATQELINISQMMTNTYITYVPIYHSFVIIVVEFT